MLLIPLTLFTLFMTGAIWSSGTNAWTRSDEPGIGTWFRIGLRIRASVLCTLSLLPLAFSIGSVVLGWLWFRQEAGQGLLYWGELGVCIISLLLVLLTLGTIIRYGQVGVPMDIMHLVLVQAVCTLLYPVIMNLCWPLTSLSTTLFLVLGILLIWFQRRILSRVTSARILHSDTAVNA